MSRKPILVLPFVSLLALAVSLASGCGRMGFDEADILPPIRFDDGRRKVSLATCSATRLMGTCSEAGHIVYIDGDGFGVGLCGEGGRFEVEVDFSAAADGPVRISGVQRTPDGRYSSPPVERDLVKDTEFCSQAVHRRVVAFAGGDGSEGDPYRICTMEQLLEVDSCLDAHLRLENDIDIGDEPWCGFGMLTGVFDGNDFVIENMHHENSGYPSGLFLTATGTIENLGVIDVQLWTSCHVGALVGILYDGGVVRRCFSTGLLHSYSDTVGGLVGLNAGEVIDSYSDVRVTDSRDCYIGGLVGGNDSTGIIRSCYATGAVTGLGAIQVGGLVGRNDGIVADTYALGAVGSNLGAEDVGGLIGKNNGTLERSFALGQVSGRTTGGLIGTNCGDVSSAYWDVERCQQESSDGGTGLSSEAMRSQASFEGWDFETVWRLDPRTMAHPVLAWQ
ncbi:MAG: hypothetical protein JXR96_27075 [Deltaproteobacteria bacterium]|nr:hypothetical protein [Deltaproteobacteria bacterium]